MVGVCNLGFFYIGVLKTWFYAHRGFSFFLMFMYLMWDGVDLQSLFFPGVFLSIFAFANYFNRSQFNFSLKYMHSLKEASVFIQPSYKSDYYVLIKQL